MTHTFSFQGSLTQYWEVLYTEYQRLGSALGQPPFEFTIPNPQIITEYIPKNGDEIIITFWDKEHRQEVLAVEAELLPDEDKEKVQVFVHPQGNPFEEPVESAISIWNEIKSTLNRAGGQEDSTTPHKLKKKRGMQERVRIALEQLQEIRLEAIKNRRSIPKKAFAMNSAKITDKTWRKYAPELWDRWDDESYK